jgi:hypothetical protein
MRGLWRYCADSARYLFGDRLGDPVADKIAEALRENRSGLSQTDINALFSGHVPAPRITASLEALRDQGLVKVQEVETGGRPVKRWVMVDLSPLLPLLPLLPQTGGPTSQAGPPIKGGSRGAEEAEKAEELAEVLRI